MMLKRTTAGLVRSALRSYASTAANPAVGAIGYTRRGEQVSSAPAPIKAVSKLSSGISVATVDQMGPLSSVAVVIHAGPRNETADSLGVSHFWKNAFIRTIPGDTIVRTIRENELRGDTLYTAVSREHLVLGSDFLRDDLVDVVPEMIANLRNTNMEVYEFMDTKAQVLNEAEAAMQNPSNTVVENLHAVAFRTGLGNSIFASEGNMGELKRASLFEFAAKHFTPDRIAVIGKDVNHKDLVTLVEKAFEGVQSAATSSTTTPTKYFGGERRLDLGTGSASEYILALPSASLHSAQYPAALVLTALLDGQKRVQWGGVASGLLGQTANATKVDSAVAFNTSYTDAGLFGVHVTSRFAAAVKPAVQSFIDTLKTVSSSAGISEAELNRAKKTALIQLDQANGATSRCTTTFVDMATCLFATQSIVDARTLADAIAKVTVADVAKLAKSAVSSKPTVSAVGPSTLPYVDEFKF